jgi:superfamily I DNA and/or RNA helicase
MIMIARSHAYVQIKIRTVDNFQGGNMSRPHWTPLNIDCHRGEEADIIILSLVRNPGEGNGGIGFLKVCFSSH